MYLTYEEYLTYGGTADETEFILIEFRARKWIDYLTDCRVDKMAEVPTAVKLAMMEVIKFDGKYGAGALADSSLLSSYSTDGYSESYGGVSDQISSAKKSLYDAVRTMLYGELDDNGVPLLYRGVYV